MRNLNYFRMSVRSFDYLMSMIENDLKCSDNAIRYCISAREKVIVTLRYLSSRCSLADLQYGCKIGKSTLSSTIQQVCKVLWKKVKSVVMDTPSKEKWMRIAEEFEEKAFLPNCIGAWTENTFY
nr:unnamed protein product [Callosobruchus analis]